VAGAYTQLMRAVMAANPDASDDQLRAEFARRCRMERHSAYCPLRLASVSGFSFNEL
jgi:hypothetical protein